MLSEYHERAGNVRCPGYDDQRQNDSQWRHHGINDEGIQAVGSDVEQTTLDLISKMVDADSELISLYYGETVTKEQAAALTAK